MNLVRSIFAVLAGYMVFVISAVLLFRFSGIDPHAEPSVDIMILTVSFGLLFSLLGGLLTQLISKTGRLMVNYALALIIAGFATFSLFKATGNHYSQLAAIFLFAPASIVGGLTHIKRIRNRGSSKAPD